jgi:alpha-tubulin suppressor-like RCC1 family protein
LAGVVVVDCGYVHTCAMLGDGTVSCWGDNSYNELGDGTHTDRSSPAVVAGVSGATGLFLGNDQTCVLGSTGGVSCWGGDLQDLAGYGEVGLGTASYAPTPMAIPSFGGVVSMGIAGSGPSQTCAVMTGGTVDGWGYSANTGRSTPMPVVWP